MFLVLQDLQDLQDQAAQQEVQVLVDHKALQD